MLSLCFWFLSKLLAALSNLLPFSPTCHNPVIEKLGAFHDKHNFETSLKKIWITEFYYFFSSFSWLVNIEYEIVTNSTQAIEGSKEVETNQVSVCRWKASDSCWASTLNEKPVVFFPIKHLVNNVAYSSNATTNMQLTLPSFSHSLSLSHTHTHFLFGGKSRWKSRRDYFPRLLRRINSLSHFLFAQY